jgi:Zn-dependent protease with chaperone function
MALLLSYFGRGKRFMRSPALLFSLRIFPFAFSLVFTVGLALPAYLRVEPGETGEAPEPYLVALAAVSLLIFAVFALRLFRLLSTTRRVSRQWQINATRIDIPVPVPIFQIEAPPALFAVMGMFKPRVFVGRAALACLTLEELEAAISHELAHVRSLDNIKRALLIVTRLPSCFRNLRALDTAWAEAAELQADESSLARTSAVDLSSAIVKIGRLQILPPTVTMQAVPACHLVSSNQSSTMALRLERLCCLLDTSTYSPATRNKYVIPLLMGLVTLGYCVEVQSLLSVTHRVMEALVK